MKAERKRRRPGRETRLIIDTNLMLLQVVGLYEPLLVPKVKRTAQYSIQDFGILQAIRSQYEHQVTTSRILAETSNLLSQNREPLRTEFFKQFAFLIATLEEVHVPASAVSGNPHFGQFGLTDLAIIKASTSEHAVLTSDSRIAAYMRSQAVEVIDFQRWTHRL